MLVSQQIKDRLLKVTSNSLVANTIKHEISKEEPNYIELIKMIKDQINANPPVMIMILGADGVIYFQNLNIAI